MEFWLAEFHLQYLLMVLVKIRRRLELLAVNRMGLIRAITIMSATTIVIVVIVRLRKGRRSQVLLRLMVMGLVLVNRQVASQTRLQVVIIIIVAIIIITLNQGRRRAIQRRIALLMIIHQMVVALVGRVRRRNIVRKNHRLLSEMRNAFTQLKSLGMDFLLVVRLLFLLAAQAMIRRHLMAVL
jgi:hypothetical protein